MVRKTKLRTKKTMRKGKGNRRSRVPPAMATAGSGQYATIVESVDGPDLNSNTIYSNWITLARFSRASAMAAQFQFYRCKKIIYTYEPLYNTFIGDNDANTYSKPYFYSVMNRIQDNQGVTYAQLLQTGARAQAFTSKKVVSYTPNWCSPGLVSLSFAGDGSVNSVVQQGLKMQKSWLASTAQSQSTPNQELLFPPINDSTAAPTAAKISANAVIQNGHVHYIYQQEPGTAIPIAKLSITAVWEFKGAKI